jgi:hypothetical protein
MPICRRAARSAAGSAPVTAGAEDHHELAGLDGEVDAVEGDDRLRQDHAEARHLDHGFHAGRSVG